MMDRIWKIWKAWRSRAGASIGDFSLAGGAAPLSRRALNHLVDELRERANALQAENSFLRASIEETRGYLQRALEAERVAYKTLINLEYQRTRNGWVPFPDVSMPEYRPVDVGPVSPAWENGRSATDRVSLDRRDRIKEVLAKGS